MASAAEDPIEALARRFIDAHPEVVRAYEQRYLTDRERAAVERAIAAQAGMGWRANPLTLGMRYGALQRLPHTELLAEKFVDAVEGRSPRQIWNLPPQHGKSYIASQFGPVWAFDMDPAIKLALTSYGHTLARDNAVFVRDFLVHHADDLRAELRPDRRRGDRFVTVENGGLIGTGVGGALTGFGAHGIIVDDAYKSWETAHSDAIREKVWKWFHTVVLTRLNVRQRGDRIIPGFIIIVQTRWHEEDLCGRLISDDEAGDGEHYEVVRLPAIAEQNDLLGRKPGELLAPLLQPEAVVRARIQAAGSYLAAGMYQQRPEPEEGGEIKRAWFQWVSQLPPAYDDELSSWDTKWKDKKGGDFVVGQVWGKVGSAFYCRAQMRGQWSMPTMKAAIALTQVRHPSCRRHVVENTGYGPEVIQGMREGAGVDYTLSADIINELGITATEIPAVTDILRRGLPGVLGEVVRGDKVVRMRRHAGILEAGNVYLPEGQDWTQVLVAEAAGFPAGAHDDCVDAMSQALKRLREMRPYVPPRSGRTAASPKPGVRTGTTRPPFG